jgi:soluble lytic murein transglycosylase
MVTLAPLPGLPAAPQELLTAAVDAYSRHDLAGARWLLEIAVQDSGVTGGRAAYLLGIVDLQQGRFPQAQAALDQAAHVLPVLEDHARYYQAMGVFHTGDCSQAAPMFLDVAVRYPDSALRGLALFWRAESLWQARDPAAPDAFHQYLQSFGDGRHAAQAWFEMGEALEQQGKWADATQAYRRVHWAFPSSPFDTPAHTRLIALASVHPLPPDATPPVVFYNRGLAEMAQGDWSDAYTDLVHARAMPGGWIVADGVLYTLGVAAFQSRRFTDALSDFRQDAHLNSLHGDDSLYYLVRIALAQGREPDALATAQILGRTYPHSSLAPRALYVIAKAREDRGAIGPALALYRQAGEQFPGTYWGGKALWQVGWLSYQTHQLASAQRAWQDVATAPDPWVAAAGLFWYARVTALLGHKELADTIYRRAAAQYGDTYYGQQAAAHLGVRIRIDVDPDSPDIPPGDVTAIDRFRELDMLAQTADADLELREASTSAPSRYRPFIGLLVSQRLEQQDQARQGIAVAEDVRDQIEETPSRTLPLVLWEALYPRADWTVITRAAARTGVDPSLLAGVIREESRFDPTAVSSAGAFGLMQLMPGTARGTARALGMPLPDQRALSDPSTNAALGATVLAEQLKRFGRVDLALAAYNAGPGAVRRWQMEFGGVDPETFVEDIPYPETRGYVKTVLESTAIYQWLYRDGHPTP